MNTPVPHPAYRQAHPLPMVLAHWAHLLSMLALGFTGFFIHDPFFGAPMGVMRQIHFVAMYVVLVALAARVWYSFAGRSALRKDTRETARDIRNFLPQPENRGQLLETVRYYLFLRRTHPATGKYNPLQKLAYTAIAGLLLLQALTGFAMYAPARSLAGAGPALAWVTWLLGGLMGVRVLHYFVTWAFIVITMVHVYLSIAEGAASLPLIFFWRESVPETEPAQETAEAPAA